MQSFCKSLIRRQIGACSNGLSSFTSDPVSKDRLFRSFHSYATSIRSGSQLDTLNGGIARFNLCFPNRNMTTVGNTVESASADPSPSISEAAPKIKFKRLDKTARHIMQIVDKEAVQDVRAQREIPDIRPGNIVQLKVEVPENKRRVSIVKGIVIARRNAGLNTTFRLRRMVGGVGIESLFPLYSPNIKEIKVLEQKKVRRAKLYYLRDKMNALKK